MGLVFFFSGIRVLGFSGFRVESGFVRLPGVHQGLQGFLGSHPRVP